MYSSLKSFLLIATLVSVLVSNELRENIPQIQLQDIPRIPIFFGVGYNVLTGNPFNNRIDPGFSHAIFDFSFSKGQKTQDGRFLIPDGVHETKTTSCSFTSSIVQYRGTQSYQNELKTRAQISGGYKGLMVEASFSASTTYQRIKNQTSDKASTVTHALAECQSYKVSIDLFNSQKLTDNFVTGAISSYLNKNWDNFITQFGSHFVYEVIMGGRAIQQISYTKTSIQQLQSLQIDVNLMAKASFAKFFASTSFDWKKYEQLMKYCEQTEENRNQIYIGGHLPANSSIQEWQQKVIEDLAPIFYKVLPISELFEKIKDQKFNANLAKTDFLAALDQYCLSRNCKKPQPDRPKPLPAYNIYNKSQSFGGSGGGPFDWAENSTTLDLKQVLLKSGTEIDKIQLLLGDNIRSIYTSAQGGQGGSAASWLVPDGQKVTQIQYRSESRIDSLTFVTNKGVKSPKFGGNGGGYGLITFPEGYRIIGFYGRSGARLDSLGFHLAKTVYPTSEQDESSQQNIQIELD